MDYVLWFLAFLFGVQVGALLVMHFIVRPAHKLIEDIMEEWKKTMDCLLESAAILKRVQNELPTKSPIQIKK